MIPITDIDDPRLSGHWTGDTRTAKQVEESVLESPKRLAAILQAMREKLMVGEREQVLNRARQILGEP
jgi:hypothetical protein